ncbi:MAG: TldD/PmbA family protein [Methanosarcinales archaeon]|nr:TldD/PmbA family protein [Methanosarcinales archaeon]
MAALQADFHDIRVLRSTGRSLFIDNGQIEQISNNFTHGISCRAMVNGSWGFVSSDDSRDSMHSLERAVKLASQTHAKSPRKSKGLAEVQQPRLHDIPVARKKPGDVPIEEKVEMLLEMHHRAKVADVTSASVLYSESELVVEYQNSEGVEAEYSLARTGFAVTAVASRNGMFQMGRRSKFDVCGYELFDRYDALKLAEEAGNTAVELLSAKVPRGGRMPVILDQELAGVFIHEAVGHAVEADHVVEGNSILANKVGSTIAAPCISVIDDPSMHGYGYYPMDDEGVESIATTVIDNGVLKSYLHSRETAAILPGTGQPGHARSQGLSRPIIRMSNTYIGNGDSGFDEMLGEMKDGIYLMGSRGGQVNPGEGVFQFNAERGYMVENGELTTPLRDVSLSGQILGILQNVQLVAGDMKMNSGRCGKGGQAVPVCDGSPHILVSEALVGGSG